MARSLDIVEQTLFNWVTADRQGQLKGVETRKAVSPEQMEISLLLEKLDLDPGLTFPPAIPGLLAGQFPAIPRTDADLSPKNHLQAIANTAAFHFPINEQGGTRLYAPSLLPCARAVAL